MNDPVAELQRLYWEALLPPIIEREMEILIRHGLIPSDPRATEAEKREFLGLDKPNAKES